MSDLLGRLRKIEHSQDELSDGGEGCTNWYRNPDGLDAADEIERLRSALETERKVTAAMGQQQRALQGDIARLERVVEVTRAFVCLFGDMEVALRDLEADDE